MNQRNKERSPRKEKKKKKKPKYDQVIYCEKEIEYTYTYGYDVTKETYPQRIERAKKDKSITRMVMQLLATVRIPMI